MFDDPNVDIVPLFGALEADVQDRAIAPAPAGRRKGVLATSIAETSLTIEGVRIVVDSGLARVPRYEPDLGLTRLETVRVSRASADQRRGRAGRTEPGVCYRLWDEPQTGSFSASLQPAGDSRRRPVAIPARSRTMGRHRSRQARVARSAAEAGAGRGARALLGELHVLDAAGRITAEGKKLRRLPLPPRLARMVIDAGEHGADRLAAEIALIVTERGLGGNDANLQHRLDNLKRDRSRRAEDARDGWPSAGPTRPRQQQPTIFLSARFSPSPIPTALPRIAVPAARSCSPTAGAPVSTRRRALRADLSSPSPNWPATAGKGRILLAAPIDPEEIETIFVAEIEDRDQVTVDPQSLSLRGRKVRRLGAITLAEHPFAIAPDAETAQQLADAIVAAGLTRLPWTKPLQQWRDRVVFLRAAEGDEWPDLSDHGLAERIDDWLVPALFDKTALSQLDAEALGNAVMTLLPYALRRAARS